MEPIVLDVEQFSDNPGNNYLQFLLSYAVMQGSSEIYFYVESENIRVYRNVPRGRGIDIAVLAKVLPKEEFDYLRGFARRSLTDGLVQRVVPEGFIEETPMPIKVLGSLESSLAQIYRLEDIVQLDDVSAVRELNVGGTRIWTGLSRIPNQEGKGYHMKINYTR